MAIKISGSTIIDDSRVIVNADKIGIGQTTPRYDLEIFSTGAPTGIAVSATSTQETDTNKAISIFNNSSTLAFSASYRGRVDAQEYHGVFKGTIDAGVAIDKANTINITVDTTGSGTHYIHFGSATSGYDGVEVDSTGLVYKDGRIGIRTDLSSAYDPTYNHLCVGSGSGDTGMLFHSGASGALRLSHSFSLSVSPPMWSTSMLSASSARATLYHACVCLRIA